MKKKLLLILLLSTMAVAACSREKGNQQMETAQFEEKQNNREHAIQLYEEVVRTYPGSVNAKTAQERLNLLKGNK